MVHESEVCGPAWFATLTYAPELVPEHGSLDPRDPTLFLKRLRRLYEGCRVSYFLAGEYGETTARPHYHAVLYGLEFLDREFFTTRSGAPVYRSESLERCWRNGISELTGLNFAAARYVASYVRKKVRHRDRPDHYERVVPETGELVQLEREYARMSKRPAIGKRWIERYWRDVYPRDYVVVDGRELKPPRFYDKWMEKYQPRVMLEVKEQRLKDIVEIGDEKLIMKEKIHRAKVALFQGRAGV